MRKTITLALHFPSAAGSVGPIDGFDDVDLPGASLLRGILEVAREQPEVTPGHLIERFREDEEGRHLNRLLAETPLDDENAAPDVLRDSLERLVREQRRKDAVKALMERTFSAPVDGIGEG